MRRKSLEALGPMSSELSEPNRERGTICNYNYCRVVKHRDNILIRN